MAALIATYLTPAHRDRPDRGCALAALGTEAAHGAPAVRAELAKGYRRLADLAAAQMTDGDEASRRARGQALASAMVGALMLARAEPDPARADSLLAENRAALQAAFGAAG